MSSCPFSLETSLNFSSSAFRSKGSLIFSCVALLSESYLNSNGLRRIHRSPLIRRKKVVNEIFYYRCLNAHRIQLFTFHPVLFHKLFHRFFRDFALLMQLSNRCKRNVLG